MPTNILRASTSKPAPVRRAPRGAKHEIVLRVGRVVLRARLLATPTAHLFEARLPIYSAAELWGQSLHFETHVEAGRENAARQSIKIGEIAYWSEADRVIVGWGPTPLSRDGEIRLPSPANIFAVAIDDVAALATARPAERVSLLAADS
jgi:uncharacterized protein